MPELPDVAVYVERLASLAVGQRLERVRVTSPFVLRSVDPAIGTLEGRPVVDVRRLGKRVVLAFDDDLFLAIHLMIAGRLRWRAPGAKSPGRSALAAFDFGVGVLFLTEAGSKRRASMHVVRGNEALESLARGGLEVLEATLDEFRTALTRENRTLKRALTDPSILSGIGNAYSDEILHRARLSPVRLTSALSDAAIEVLFAATQSTLTEWVERLRAEVGEGFPEKVTAFRKGMAAHGRYGEPCPVCDSPIQRIVHGNHETNYCPTCQTGGKLLADRALSRLLKKDWPKTLEELEERREGARRP